VLGGARLHLGRRGRGAQMNGGARMARHEWLLFLHADSELRDPQLLAQALTAMQDEPPHGAGHFPLRFMRTRPGHEGLFRYLEAKTRLNRPGTVNGDQGLLLRREFFTRLGGFDESLPFLEDARLAAKIEAQGRWRLLPGELHTSARRFETEGPRQRYTLMALLMGLHAAGVNEFFTQAPAVYRAQSDARQLDLQPFVQLARQLLAQRGRWRTLRAVAPYVRGNTWQIFFARDVARGDGTSPCLAFHDRRLAPLLERPLFDALTAALLALWLYLWLPLELRLRR
jgi:hypothetical protein